MPRGRGRAGGLDHQTTVVHGQGDILTVQPYQEGNDNRQGDSRRFILEVANDAASNALLASLPLLDRLLTEKLAAVRERRLEEMIEFLAERMLTPNAIDLKWHSD